MELIKNSLILSFLLVNSLLLAQEFNDRVSIEFESQDLTTIFNLIENQTGYKFFYIDKWLEESDTHSGNYREMNINDVLALLLKNTNLNYYIMESRIILTQNNRIYDYLPDKFFNKVGDSISEEVVYKNDQSELPLMLDKNSERSFIGLEVIKIGKAESSYSLNNYKVSGTIIDYKTETPIQDAVITLSGQHENRISNDEGYFSFTLPSGIYTITVNAFGMNPLEKKIAIYGNGTLDLKLTERVEELDTVVLESTNSNNVEDVITKTTVNIKESKNIPLALGERDVLRVATTLPGITTTGEGGLGYNVRGGKSDQNLILLDNAVVYSPQHFFGIFSALNPFVLSEANIYKSNIPAEYGGRLSSVFDLKTKNADKSKIKGEVSIGPVTGNLLLETPIIKEKSGFILGGRAAYANYILERLEEESLQNSEASFYDIITKYDHKINNKSNLSITGYLSRDDFSITSDSLFIYKNKALSLQWDYKLADNLSGDLIMTTSQYDFNIEFDRQSNDDFRLNYDINELFVKFRFDHLLNKDIKLIYGLSNKLYNVNPGSIEPLNEESDITKKQIQKEKALETAFFVSLGKSLDERIKLDTGLRFSIFNALGPRTQNTYTEGSPRDESTIQETNSYDDLEIAKTYAGLEYRLSLRYLLNENSSLKASYNKTFQFVHSLSNNTTASPIDTWKLSDLNIKPQEAHQISIGYFKDFNDKMYELGLEGFYKKLNNTVDFKTGADILLNENVETQILQGEGKAYGVELLLKKNKGRLYGWLGYTYSRSFNKFNGQFEEERINNGEFFPSNFDKPHDLSLVLNYKFTKRYSLSTNFIYQTGRPITYPIGQFTFNDTQFTVYSDRNKFRIPDFYRLDLGFNIEGNHRRNKVFHSFWTISVYNVLGRNNPYSVYFVTEEGEVKGLKSSIFSIPVPSITYNFKF